MNQRSLFGEILDWMLAPLLLVWPMSVALTWVVAQNIANGPFDRALEETTNVLMEQVQASQGHLRLNLPLPARDLLRSDDTDQVYFLVRTSKGEVLGGDRDLPLPSSDELNPAWQVLFRDEQMRGATVRVAYAWMTIGEDAARQQVLVQVAETLGKRSRLATEVIKGVMLPQFIILPLAVMLVWFALTRGLTPLNELQIRIRQRKPDDLSPLDDRQAPEEVSPLVRAINDLLMRLQESVQTQKRFLADAAHQMKTPLAGLRMQAELAQREIEPQELKKSLRQIARSSERSAHVVNQLLALARSENPAQWHRHERINLREVVTEVIQDFVARASEKQIDLGFEEKGLSRAPLIKGHALMLHEMLRNLVDNAIAYTPEGGTVTVRLMGDPYGQVVVMQVEDSGPGIPPEERELVFEPFYRVLGTQVDGSGLGLSIVRQIALQHGSDVQLDYRSPGMSPPGTRFSMRFMLIDDEAEHDDFDEWGNPRN